MIDPADWATVLRLLDELLDLPDDAARARWLQALPPQHRHLQPALEKMMRERATQARGLERTEALSNLFARQRPGLSAGDRIGPYRLLRELGRGGMSEVWLAEPAAAPGAPPVALKLPAVSLASAAFLERFARERDFLARLQHPHIAQLIDAGVSPGGQHYLALQYVDGLPITTYCDQARLGVRARLALFQQVLQAVQHAHGCSVLHRDLKPPNILVTAAGEVRLLDFGIAKLLVDGSASETELTERWGRMFTPDYASPEQIGGQPVSARTDVYALGVLLYELLCGQRPLSGGPGASRHLLETAILGVEPAPPSQRCDATSVVAQAEGGPRPLARLLSRDLDAIVLRALRKDPAQRTPDVVTIAAELARVLAGQRVRTTLQRARDQALALVRRHRAAVSLSSILLLALAGVRHSHQAAADLEALFASEVPPAQRVVLVTIGPEDHQRLFGGRSPLDPAVLQRLIERIVAGRPAVLGVDVDTSAAGFAALAGALDADALGRTVWGRDLAAGGADAGAPLQARPVLGGWQGGAPVRSALAVTLVDGGSGAVRWFQRAVPTAQGLLPTMPVELVRPGAPWPPPAGATLQRGIRFTRSARQDLPASVVLAPGFDWRGRIEGRAVLLGGRYDRADLHPTALGAMHGVDILANAAETERTGHAHARPGVASILAIGLQQLVLTILMFDRLAIGRAVAASLAGGAVLTWALAASGWFPAWSYAAMAVVAVVLNQLGVELFKRRRDALRSAAMTLWRRLRARPHRR